MSDTKKKPKKKPAKLLRTRSPTSVGYKKAEETRQRILDAALQAFGEASFKAVTTRRICAAADVSLPTLTYYFGDKEGLYRACAEAVVERYRGHTSGAAANATRILSEPRSPEEARTHLKAVIGALAGLLVESSEAEDWVQFVGWELRDPGPAFEILYEHLWRPGTELTSRLIGRICGRVAPNDDDRIRALLLISSLPRLSIWAQHLHARTEVVEYRPRRSYANSFKPGRTDRRDRPKAVQDRRKAGSKPLAHDGWPTTNRRLSRRHEKGCCADQAKQGPYGVQPSPLCDQRPRFGPRVLVRRCVEPFVGRQDGDQGEGPIEKHELGWAAGGAHNL